MAKEELKMQANVPVQVMLKYPTGKLFPSSFEGGIDRVMFTLTDDRVIFAPVFVQKKLEELGITRGQPFEICKSLVGRKTEWIVKPITRPAPPLPATPAAKPQAVAALLNGSQDLHNPYDQPQIKTQLEDALKTALDAAVKAEKFSQQIGHPVQFDKDDIRLMAQTLVINAFNAKGRAA